MSLVSSKLTLVDVKHSDVAIALPRLRVGDRVHLRFRVQKSWGGRTSVLVIDQDAQVISSLWDASKGLGIQVLTAELVGNIPTWKAVKKVSNSRKPCPTHNYGLVT